MMTLSDMDLTEEEKKVVRSRFLGVEDEHNPKFAKERYTVFFSDDVGLDPISLRGQVPCKGDRMSFRSFSVKDSLPAYNHDQELRSWYVKEVYWNYTVQSTKKDQLLRDHTVTAEVHVDFYRWQYRKQQFLIKFWYVPKRKLKDCWKKVKNYFKR